MKEKAIRKCCYFGTPACRVDKLSKEQNPEGLPDARLTTIIKNNVVGQGSGKPGEALRQAQCDSLCADLCRTCSPAFQRDKFPAGTTARICTEAGSLSSFLTPNSLHLADIYLHEQTHLHRRILPTGKSASLYADKADTGHPHWHIDHSGKMGTDDGVNFIR